MTAQPLRSDRPGAPRADIGLFRKQCSQPQLETMLRIVQWRLGALDECPGDVYCAQMIAHQLNNVRTVQRVDEILRQLDEAENFPDARDGTPD